MTEVNRYKPVRMITENGNNIVYAPHGPEVVPATAYDQIKAENQELATALAEARGLKPEWPPRPPEGEGLPRYGLRWNGPSQPLAVPMDDGYWTPWHLAHQLQELVEVGEKLIGERDRLLDAIPHCAEHGPCIPYAIQWVQDIQVQVRVLQEERDNWEKEAARLAAELQSLKHDASPGLTQQQQLARDHEAIARAIQEGEDIPDFSPGNGNRARRRARELGVKLELPK